MQRQFSVFLLRWLLNSSGLWIAVTLFGTGKDTETPEGAAVFLFAGLIFSIVNALLKPIIVIISLPALVVTLGLFMVIINGFMVFVSLSLAPGISMVFWHAVLTGILLSVLNYIVSNLIDMQYVRKRGEKRS